MTNDLITNYSITNLWQQDSDQHHDYPAEQPDERIQDSEIKETDDDEESIGLEAGEEIPGSFRNHSHQYLRSVQRGNGDQIESRQGEVDLNHIIDEDESSTRGRCRKEPDKQQGEEGEEHVCKNPCRRNEDESLAPIRNIVKVDGNRPRPSKPCNKKHQGPDGVEMLERVKGETARPFGGRITHFVSDPAVRHLMDDDRKKKRNGDKSKC